VKSKDADKACPAGNPIYPLSGIKTQSEALPFTLGGVQLALRYDQRYSLADANGKAPMPFPHSNGFSAIWELNITKGIIWYDMGGGPSMVAMDIGGGKWVTYSQPSRGSLTYVSEIDPLDSVTKTDTGWRHVDARGGFEDLFSASGVLQETDFSDGRRLLFAPSQNQLMISDEVGRSVTLAMVQNAQLNNALVVQGITGSDGQSVTFSYSPLLSGISWVDGTSKKFLYNGDIAHLAGIVDENHTTDDGVVYAQFGYDSAGRANDTMHYGGVERYSVRQSTPSYWNISDVYDDTYGLVVRTLSWALPSGTVMTLPNGQEAPIAATLAGGALGVASQSQPAGSGCAATSSATTFDGAGNVSSRDDFNGNRACFAWDARNVQAVALDGLRGGASGKACPAVLSTYAPDTSDPSHPERKTTTTWHPDWALKAREAEPKKITTWVYNGQPDPIAGGTASCASTAPALPDGKPIAVLCARYEQATTDATGALGLSATTTGATRGWAYTYNQFGQVLTETTPKLSPTDALSHTTTYVYYTDTSISSGAGHTIGDLQTMTNPLQQTTKYTSYDAAGRLLSSSDANGAVTTQTYWPRGWLKSQTVTPPGSAAPQVTSYAYWPTGLLKTVTLPDTSTLSYVYDDAHRLTDVTDSAGNKMHYVLDNVGNRTSEQVSDASGNMASTVTRVFDALNRVQSQTGLPH
jgi:YD repeat-containing protein